MIEPFGVMVMRFLFSGLVAGVILLGGFVLSLRLSKRGWAIAGMPLDHCYMLAVEMVGGVGLLMILTWAIMEF